MRERTQSPPLGPGPNNLDGREPVPRRPRSEAVASTLKESAGSFVPFPRGPVSREPLMMFSASRPREEECEPGHPELCPGGGAVGARPCPTSLPRRRFSLFGRCYYICDETTSGVRRVCPRSSPFWQRRSASDARAS